MEYQETLPQAALRPHVKCYWKLIGADTPPVLERVFPDGCTELIFHRADPFLLRSDNGSFVPQANALYFGQIERFIQLRPGPHVETFGVRFHPAGAAALLGCVAGETRGIAISWDTLLGSGARRLQERVLEAASVGDAIRIVENDLLERLVRASAIEPALSQALATIEANAGSVCVAELARDVGLSLRQLERQFASRVGLSPKRLAMIIRLRQALGAIAGGGLVSLTALAHASGYFDQAHFVRDFRRITGLTPSRFMRENGVGHLIRYA